MAALDIAVVGPALPAIGEHFGLSERALPWVFNTFVLFNLMSVPLMSKCADVLGRRRIYLTVVSIFALGSVVVAASPTFTVMLGGRALQGLAASGIFPVASAVVGDTFPRELRGRALGILGAVFGIAFIIGPILGGVLLLFGWQWLFTINVPLAAIVFMGGLRYLPHLIESQKRKFDVLGMLLLGGMLGVLAYGVSQLDTSDLWKSLSSPEIWPAFILVLILLPIFIRIERVAEDPVVRPGLFRNRQIMFAALIAGGAGMSEAAFIFFPALASEAFGVSHSNASFMLLPMVCAVAIASPIAGRVLDRVGSKTIVLCGSGLMTAGLVMVGQWGMQAAMFYLGSTLMGAGLAALLGPALAYILLNESREEERTVSQGVITVFISIGQLTASAFIGAVAASGDGGPQGFQSAILIIAGIGLLLTLLSTGLKRKTDEQGILSEG